MLLFRSAAIVANSVGTADRGDFVEDCHELVLVVEPGLAIKDHAQSDHAADDGRSAEGIERDGAAHPGAHAGQQLHVAGAHAADGIGRAATGRGRLRSPAGCNPTLPIRAWRG